MAKRKKFSLNGAFRQLFRAHPEWLNIKKNEAVLAQFAADHPSIPINKKAKQAMANAKNLERHGGTKGTKGKKGKVAEMRAVMAANGRGSGSALQLLEDHIDDCLAMAKQIGKGEIDLIIKHLHRARNLLVVAIEG